MNQNVEHRKYVPCTCWDSIVRSSGHNYLEGCATESFRHPVSLGFCCETKIQSVRISRTYGLSFLSLGFFGHGAWPRATVHFPWLVGVIRTEKEDKNDETPWPSYKAMESSTRMHIIELQNQNSGFK